MKHIDIQPGAKVGRKNGLSILLDTETFDYSFHLKASEGKNLIIQLSTLGLSTLRDVLFEFHLKFWNTGSIGIPVRSLL